MCVCLCVHTSTCHFCSPQGPLLLSGQLLPVKNRGSGERLCVCMYLPALVRVCTCAYVVCAQVRVCVCSRSVHACASQRWLRLVNLTFSRCAQTGLHHLRVELRLCSCTQPLPGLGPWLSAAVWSGLPGKGETGWGRGASCAPPSRASRVPESFQLWQGLERGGAWRGRSLEEGGASSPVCRNSVGSWGNSSQDRGLLQQSPPAAGPAPHHSP